VSCHLALVWRHVHPFSFVLTPLHGCVTLLAFCLISVLAVMAARGPPKLKFASSSIESTLFRANSALASKRFDNAHELYTKVLYQLSPGHVVAFLNRALTYICLGYPELAVTDCYRAAQVCHELRYTRSHSDVQRTIAKHTTRYIQNEKTQVSIGAPWASEPECFIGCGWLHSSFARITLKLGDIKATSLTKPGDKPSFSSSPVPWAALESIAIYRLCGSLWLCGGGALKDALGLLSDFMFYDDRKAHMLSREADRDSFLDLGNAIMNDTLANTRPRGEGNAVTDKLSFVNRVEYPWDHYVADLDKPIGLSHAQGLTESFTVPCAVKRAAPACDHPGYLYIEAEQDIYTGAEICTDEPVFCLASETHQGEDNCVYCDHCACAMLLPDVKVDNTSSSNKENVDSKAREPLRGQNFVDTADKIRDFKDFEEWEIPWWAMRGRQSEEVLRKAKEASKHRLASRREMLEELITLVEKQEAAEVSGLPLSRPATPTASDDEISPCDSKSLPPVTPKRGGQHSPTPSPYTKLMHTPDYHQCSQCPNGFYCSSECYGDSVPYHANLCASSVEDGIKQHFLGEYYLERSSSPVSVPSTSSLTSDPFDWQISRASHTCLQHLAVVRFFSAAAHSETHVLELPGVAYLNSGAFKAPDISSPDRCKFGDVLCSTPGDFGFCAPLPEHPVKPSKKCKMLPWSFKDNVILPLHYLSELGVSSWQALSEYDGWILNTLMAKIEHSMVVSRGSHVGKCYEEKGNLGSEEKTDWPTTGTRPAGCPSVVWTASFSPVLAMLREGREIKTGIGSDEEEDKANVRLYRVLNGWKVFARGGRVVLERSDYPSDEEDVRVRPKNHLPIKTLEYTQIREGDQLLIGKGERLRMSEDGGIKFEAEGWAR